jgi:Tol biopolymer transport system component/C-terminal processing protease CtpA/Prc
MKKAVVYLWLASFLMSFAPVFPQESNAPLWMRYPVISPDGSAIIFAYKGDLYKVAANGGVASPLTISDSYEFMPVFSDDGQTVYFAADIHGNFDVYSVSIKGGTPKRLTFNSSNDYPQCLSPDKKSILFIASRMDNAQMSQFPYGALGELYSVPIDGGREKQELSIAMEEVKYNHAGTQFFFQDKKGYEDTWRKHHTSAVTRDLWSYTVSSKDFKQLTTFSGEDRNPVWSANDSEMYYLSEKSGSFNVWKQNANGSGEATQLTKFDKNPVRFLSIDKNNTLCYGFDGEIYTQKPGQEPQKVAITIETAERNSEYTIETTNAGASELKVSPNGKEIAFINHGEVYVVSMEGGVTKRITNTPEEERNLSFSPDGKQLIYASERNNKWSIYQTKLVRDTEKYFYSSTVLQEDPLIVDEHENFQARFSPDGKEIAYIQDRTGVAVFNIAAKKSRTVQAADQNYSYSDGDQSFDWSPDSRYLLVQFLQDGYWRAQVGLIDVTGKEPMFQLTQNGFDNSGAYFNMDGNAVLFYSNKNGMKNVASHGAQYDIYGLFLNQDAYDQFKMKKVDYELWKEKKAEDDKAKEEAKTTAEKDKKDNKKKDDKKDEPAKPLNIEKEGLELRKARLTENSSFLGDGFLNKEGTKLYYYTSYGEGMDLWVRDFKEQETKVLAKLNAGWAGSSDVDKDIKNVFSIVDGKIVKIDLEKGERKDIAYNAEITRDGAKERAYLFEHIWRQTKEKFYVSNMQGVDWAYYKTVYAKFLPHINNNKDFAELCSEMLGELNASHTGCFYRPDHQNPDETAQLGAFFDESFTGDGLKIQEVVEKGPLVSSTSKIKAGVIIEKIDNQVITANTNYYQFLNRKAGKYTLLSLYDPTTKQRWEETIKPVQAGAMNELLYQRWVKRMQIMTDKLSNGQLGYMHVRGMDDGSYREFYDQVMGKYVTKKALVVDTRFNGGGWLHDDLATFLSGKQYINFVPRENQIGIEPGSKWTKPSVVLMSEGNYSDAHMFPVVYKTLGIGKLVGMPVAGTGTAVWWESMLDRTLVFGIPQVGVMTMEGKYYENNQCEPDIKVENDYPTMLKGEDAQLKKAVESLMEM